MASVSLCVPLAPDGPARERNWRFLRDRYETHFPKWEIVTSAGPEPWSKGAALHSAVEASSGDRLVLADADLMVPFPALTTALNLRVDWVMPYRYVYRLTDYGTQKVIRMTNLEENFKSPPPNWQAERPMVAVQGGGIEILTREAWEVSGGIDPRFEGWGGEDLSFGRALKTLVGQCKLLEFPAWHLWHPGYLRGRRGSPASEALAVRYLEATLRPNEMHNLTREWRKSLAHRIR